MGRKKRLQEYGVLEGINGHYTNFTIIICYLASLKSIIANVLLKEIFKHIRNSRCLINKKRQRCRLPWWHSGEESASQRRRPGFESWSWTIPRVTKQLNPCCVLQLRSPHVLEPMLRSKRSRGNGKPTHSAREWPSLPTAGELERAHAGKTQHSLHKYISKIIFLKKDREAQRLFPITKLSHREEKNLRAGTATYTYSCLVTESWLLTTNTR